MMQEGCGKDVERVFGVLQTRFAIIKGLAHYWKKQVFHDIMSALIIIHNMIIEDEVETYGSIVDFNVMSILEVNMILNKIEQF